LVLSFGRDTADVGVQVKTFYRVFTHQGEFFDFPAMGSIYSFIVNARIEGGFMQDNVFVPFDEMRLVMKIQVAEPVAFMPTAGNA
jgi:hypothetical protein